MIYLLYGSNIQGSLQRLNEIIQEYRKKQGDLNVYKFDVEEDDPLLIKNAIGAPSLFTFPKLVVLKYISQAKDTEIYQILDKAKKSPDINILLWDRELEVKDLQKLRPWCDKIQEFRLAESQAKLPDVNIFRLGDTFFTSRKEGLRNLLSLLRQGHDEFGLFSYLTNHARTLLTVRHYLENKKPVPAKHGIHPFVVKKASVLVRSLTIMRLRRTHRQFLEEDRRIKLGMAKPRESLTYMLFQE